MKEARRSAPASSPKSSSELGRDSGEIRCRAFSCFGEHEHPLPAKPDDAQRARTDLLDPEFEAAADVGFGRLLFDEDAFSHGDVDGAFARLPNGNSTPLLYRGWIQTEESFRRFHEALADRGYRLASTPDQYAEATFFPNYFSKIRDRSPAAVWTDSDDTFEAWSASRKLGNGPFVLKDHVKSAKHQWHDACFVPKDSGREDFERIAANLLVEQGLLSHRGFVIRQTLRAVETGRSESTGLSAVRGVPPLLLGAATSGRGALSRATRQLGRLTPFVEIAQRFDASRSRWTPRKRKPATGSSSTSKRGRVLVLAAESESDHVLSPTRGTDEFRRGMK